jgi:hypothetical protein
VLAVFRKQMEEQQDWLQAQPARRGVIWKRGDKVRVDQDGGAYAGLSQWSTRSTAAAGLRYCWDDPAYVAGGYA